MHEIDCDTDLLEPVSYEIKLAAFNAMIPSGENEEQTELSCAICAKVYNRAYELKSHLSRHFGLKDSSFEIFFLKFDILLI